MKRPHRRIHLLAWLLIAPLTAAAAAYFLTMKPSAPVTDIPPEIVESNAEGA